MRALAESFSGYTGQRCEGFGALADEGAEVGEERLGKGALSKDAARYSFTAASVGPDSVAFMRTVALGLATSPVHRA